MATRPLFTTTFWLDALERLLKTLAQVVGATFTADALTKGLNQEQALTVIIAAAIYSLTTSVISSGIGEPGSASLLNPAPPDTLKDNGQALLQTVLIAAAVAVLVFAILVAASDSITF